MTGTARRARPEAGPAVKLVAFAAILAAVFLASFGVGRAVAPDDVEAPAASTTTSTVHEGPHDS